MKNPIINGKTEEELFTNQPFQVFLMYFSSECCISNVMLCKASFNSSQRMEEIPYFHIPYFGRSQFIVYCGLY